MRHAKLTCSDRADAQCFGRDTLTCLPAPFDTCCSSRSAIHRSCKGKQSMFSRHVAGRKSSCAWPGTDQQHQAAGALDSQGKVEHRKRHKKRKLEAVAVKSAAGQFPHRTWCSGVMPALSRSCHHCVIQCIFASRPAWPCCACMTSYVILSGAENKAEPQVSLPHLIIMAFPK